MADAPPERPTVRVVLLSPERRVLLLHCRNRMTATPPTGWVTPGGGMEPGESLEQAARREVREETGITDIEIGPVVWTRDRVGPLHSVATLFRQSFVVAFTAAEHTVDFGGAMADEREDLIAARWWSLEDLAATTEAMFPPSFVGLIGPVMAGRYPDPPVVIAD